MPARFCTAPRCRSTSHSRQVRPAMRDIRAVGAAVLAVCVVAGCAGMPNSGSVHTAQQSGSDTGLDRPDVRLVAPPPQKGASADQIVSGFLLAMADFAHGHSVARRYLSPEIRDKWRPDVGTDVYEPTSLQISQISASPHSATFT